MSYSAFPIKKSPDRREQDIIEAYRTIENYRNNLKTYLQMMSLLTDQERRSINREISRLTLWMADHYKQLKQTKEPCLLNQN